jgi:hypothetical protein
MKRRPSFTAKTVIPRSSLQKPALGEDGFAAFFGERISSHLVIWGAALDLAVYAWLIAAMSETGWIVAILLATLIMALWFFIVFELFFPVVLLGLLALPAACLSVCLEALVRACFKARYENTGEASGVIEHFKAQYDYREKTKARLAWTRNYSDSTYTPPAPQPSNQYNWLVPLAIGWWLGSRGKDE